MWLGAAAAGVRDVPGRGVKGELRQVYVAQNVGLPCPARQSGVPLELILRKLNHANFAPTKRYPGITDDELQAIAEGMYL